MKLDYSNYIFPTDWKPDEPKEGMKRAYGGLLIQGDQILLRRPTGEFGGYVWTFAKGRRDADETPEEAALREVREETGYEAEIVGVIPRWFLSNLSATLFYVMRPVGEQKRFGPETERTAWANLEAARELISLTREPSGRARDLPIIDWLDEM